MKDYKGLKGNMLTAVSFVRRVNNKTFWLFLCDCGKDKITNPCKVLSKNPTCYSCGCKEYRKSTRNRDITIDIERTKKDLFYRYRKSAVKRNYNFELSYKHFISLTKSNCHYCNQKPSREHKFYIKDTIMPSYICNGIDRKNNNEGYIEGNCLPCCTICNRAKNNLEYDSFINWIEHLKKNKSL